MRCARPVVSVPLSTERVRSAGLVALTAGLEDLGCVVVVVEPVAVRAVVLPAFLGEGEPPLVRSTTTSASTTTRPTAISQVLRRGELAPEPRRVSRCDGPRAGAPAPRVVSARAGCSPLRACARWAISSSLGGTGRRGAVEDGGGVGAAAGGWPA